MNRDTTPRYAVIGNPVAHSRSPAIHRLFGEQTGIRLDYDRIEAPIDQFASTVEDFFANGGSGLNVTVPFKLQAWQLAQKHLSARAEQAQAVNTLWMQDGSLQGCNTDGPGLVDDLTRLGVMVEQPDILVVGAGGATRGVVGPLLQAGARHLHIVNRTRQRAVELVAAPGSCATGSDQRGRSGRRGSRQRLGSRHQRKCQQPGGCGAGIAGRALRKGVARLRHDVLGNADPVHATSERRRRKSHGGRVGHARRPGSCQLRHLAWRQAGYRASASGDPHGARRDPSRAGKALTLRSAAQPACPATTNCRRVGMRPSWALH